MYMSMQKGRKTTRPCLCLNSKVYNISNLPSRDTHFFNSFMLPPSGYHLVLPLILGHLVNFQPMSPFRLFNNHLAILLRLIFLNVCRYCCLYPEFHPLVRTWCLLTFFSATGLSTSVLNYSTTVKNGRKLIPTKTLHHNTSFDARFL